MLDDVDAAPDREPLLGSSLGPAQPLYLPVAVVRVTGLVAGEHAALRRGMRGKAGCQTGERLGDIKFLGDVHLDEGAAYEGTELGCTQATCPSPTRRQLWKPG